METVSNKSEIPLDRDDPILEDNEAPSEQEDDQKSEAAPDE